MTIQRYVSNELTHFVGRDLVESMPEEREREEREEKQYSRLIEILRSCCLRTGGEKKGVNADPAAGKEGLNVQHLVTYTVGARSLATMFKSSVVCFCDIPAGDIAIHVSKYGPFGIAFNRKFLLAHGVNPVLYLAEDADLGEGDTLGQLFVEEMNRTLSVLTQVATARERGPGEPPPRVDPPDVSKRLGNDAFLAHQFLMIRVFSLVKGFLGVSADEDRDNFYMEREWRRYGNLEFTLDDVCRVYLPQRFG